MTLVAEIVGMAIFVASFVLTISVYGGVSTHSHRCLIKMHRMTWLLLVAVLATLPRPTSGQRDAAHVNQHKALFVYNVLPFVRWPAEAFQSSSEALRVQIIGRDLVRWLPGSARR